MLIKENNIVLFQGDSITDTGRNQEQNLLGTGYAYIVASLFSAICPEKQVTFINRGISGNRVRDLEQRWEQDCLDLNPDVLSILIGINDCWRRYQRNEHTTTEEFRAGYERLLIRVKEHNEGIKIMLLEPFLLPTLPEQERWREDLDPKIQAVRALARTFHAKYVPLDGLFAEATVLEEPVYWASDGVHPTQAGHGLIARAWLKAVDIVI